MSDPLSKERIAVLRALVGNAPMSRVELEDGLAALDALLAERTLDADVVERAVAWKAAIDDETNCDPDLTSDELQALYDACERRGRG